MYHSTGNVSTSPLVAALDSSYHADSVTLHDAVPPNAQNGSVAASISGDTLTLDPAELGPYVPSPTLVLDNEVDALHYHSIFVMIPGYAPVTAIDLVTMEHTVHRTPYFFALTPRSGSR